MKLQSLLLFATAAVGSACVYDADERCGAAMTFDATLDICVCDTDAVADGLGCKRCAADEVALAGACSCATGSSKNADNICVEVAGLGDACASSAECTTPEYPVCAPATGGSSANTCTNACTSDDDCGTTYTCALWEAAPYCRTFSGFGATCSDQADCAGKDAAFCESFQTHTCVVAGCTIGTDDCPRGLQCCDFSGFGLPNLCAEACQ
jgi:hypothetical protein